MQDLLQAAAPLLAPAFTAWGVGVSWLEVIAFVLALAMVALNMRVHPMAWPLAIASSLLYALLFADARLWGEATLQLVFVALAAWGWTQWLRGRRGEDAALTVQRLSNNLRMAALVGTLALWPLMGWVLDTHTNSDVPYLDALPTTASLLAQVLLGRKLIENWPVWLGVNIASVGLFAVKGLWLTVLLYALFAILSVAGWRAWTRLEGRAHA